MQKTEIVPFIETERAGIVVGIHYEKATTRLVVFVPKPVFDKLHQLAADVHALELLVHSDTPNQRSRIAASSLRVVDGAVQSITVRFVQMEGFDAVVSKGEECHYAVRFLFGNPTIGLAHQFIGITFGIVVKEIIKVGITTCKCQATFPYMAVVGKHYAVVKQ